LFKIDTFLSSFWEFFEINKHKILPILKNNGVNINLNNNIYRIGNTVSSDLIELIHLIYQKGNIIESLKSFFTEIGENIFFDYSAIKEYNDIVGMNGYLNMFVLGAVQFNSDKNTYKIVNFSELKSDFGDIIDKFNFMFPEHSVFNGDEAFLHINSFGIITAATVKTNIGYVTYKAPYCDKVCVFNENKNRELLLSGDSINICFNNIKEENLVIFTGIDNEEYNIRYSFKKVILNTKKPSEINFVYGTDLVKYNQNIYISDRHIEDYICKYIKTHKGWSEKLSEIDNVISNVSNEIFSNVIKYTSKNISESASERLKQIRVSKTANILNLLDIELKATKYNSFFTSNDVVCKINGIYETITISESGRSSFINKPELLESVRKIKHIYKKFKHIDEKDILSMVFNEIKIQSLSLNKITDLVCDGLWEVNGDISLVSKNKHSNLDILLENGIYPYPKHVTIGGKDYKTLVTILDKIPDNLTDYYITFLKMIFKGKMRYELSIKTKYDANKFIKHFTNSSNFIKHISISKMKTILKNVNNSKLVLMGILNETPDEFIEMNYDEYLGTKKEYGVEYQIKNYSSLFLINIDEDNGIDFENIPDGNELIDSLIKYIVNCDKPKSRFKVVIDKLEEKIF